MKPMFSLRRWFPLTLALLAVFASGAASAQDLPQGYINDDPAAAAETNHSQQVVVQPVQDSDEVAGEYGEYEDTDPSAMTEFQPVLAPYGTWVDDPTYGTVWVPAATVVGPDFAPYQTAGHWALTEDGDWMWVSYYDWGYIPFHYGRWVWIPARGWAWIPGRVYAPAWVVWRVGDGGYIGWAPMPPTYYWSSGVAVSLWVVPPAAFVFCPSVYVFHRHVHTYVIHDHHVVHHAARHTHTYRPAQPTGSTPGGSQAASGKGPSSNAGKHLGSGRRTPASPTLAEAGVPSSAAPKSFASGDPRALAFAGKGSKSKAMSSARPSKLKDPFARGKGTIRRSDRVRMPSTALRTPGRRSTGKLQDPWQQPQQVQPGPSHGPWVAPGPQRLPRAGTGQVHDPWRQPTTQAPQTGSQPSGALPSTKPQSNSSSSSSSAGSSSRSSSSSAVPRTPSRVQSPRFSPTPKSTPTPRATPRVTPRSSSPPRIPSRGRR